MTATAGRRPASPPKTTQHLRMALRYENNSLNWAVRILEIVGNAVYLREANDALSAINKRIRESL